MELTKRTSAPFFSIIMPVYNSERFLAHAVECLINQSFKEIEIILKDDGSSDSSPDICDNFANMMRPRILI